MVDDAWQVLKANRQRTNDVAHKGVQAPAGEDSEMHVGDIVYNVNNEPPRARKSKLPALAIGAAILASGGLGAAIPWAMGMIKDTDTDTQYQFRLIEDDNGTTTSGDGP